MKRIILLALYTIMVFMWGMYAGYTLALYDTHPTPTVHTTEEFRYRGTDPIAFPLQRLEV